MSDLQLLFLVLVALYLWECACWLRRGSVALLTWFGRRWRVAHPGSLLGNEHGAFVFTVPLPPLGSLICGNQFPLSLSPDGVLAYVAANVNPGRRPPQTGRYVRFDQIESVKAEGRKVFVNGDLLLKTSSPTFAQALVREVLALQRTAPRDRAAAIERLLRESFDEKRIRAQWQEFRKRTRPMRWVTNALFGYLFVFAPLLIWCLGLRTTWPGLLIGLLALTTGTAVAFRSVHKCFYPDAADDRFTHFLTILLSPATAIRTRDLLSRALFEACHPLALAGEFCSETGFPPLAEIALREVRFPALPLAPPDPECRAAEEFSRQTLRRVMESYLTGRGIDPDQVVRAPARTDPDCLTYCPRCQAQFTVNAGTCADCGGLALVPFADEAGVRL